VNNVKLKRATRRRRASAGICILGPTASGRVILENFRANGREVDCFVDPQGKFRGESWAGLPVVKLTDQLQLPELKRMGLREFVVVSGATAARQRLYEACIEAGLSPAQLIHPTATVLSDVDIDAGCVVGARTLLGPNVHLDFDVLVGMGSLLDHDCLVGRHVTIGVGSTLGARSQIHDCAFIGDGVVVLAARTVGVGSIVISGSVVTQDIPAACIAAGVPARLIRRKR
jgi:UDP-perosamine 4-acetyltransferase